MVDGREEIMEDVWKGENGRQDSGDGRVYIVGYDRRGGKRRRRCTNNLQFSWRQKRDPSPSTCATLLRRGGSEGVQKGYEGEKGRVVGEKGRGGKGRGEKGRGEKRRGLGQNGRRWKERTRA